MVDADILGYLSEQSATGEAVLAALGVEAVAFKQAARQLWADGMLQGQLMDGCCSAPCGTMCVSAMRMDREWQLSKKGRLRQKVLAARRNVT